MEIEEIEAQRQEANSLFRQQRIAEALAVYEASLARAVGFVSPSMRNEALEEQLSLLTYNISVIYYKRREFGKALRFALESLGYCRSDRVLYKICAIYLRLGMIGEYRDVYDQVTNKLPNPEIASLLKRIKLSESSIGMYLRNRLTADELFELSTFVCDGKVIPMDTVERILRLGECVLLNSENVVYVESRGEVVVFGDTHGQYFDVASVLNTVFDGKRVFVFNGDFVDRGTHSVENFLVILGLKILFPGHVYLNRGNHELSDLHRAYGFCDEIARKYPFSRDSVYQAFQNVFRALPICTVVNGKVFITHGGLPAMPVDLDALQQPYRMMDSCTDTPLRDLMWSDPDEIVGVGENRRGAGIVFGSDITQGFLHLNNLDLLVRSHQSVEGGYRTNHDGRVVTVFSAPNYEGTEGPGSYLVLNPMEHDEEAIVVSEATRYKVVRFDKSSGREPLECLRNLSNSESKILD